MARWQFSSASHQNADNASIKYSDSLGNSTTVCMREIFVDGAPAASRQRCRRSGQVLTKSPVTHGIVKIRLNRLLLRVSPFATGQRPFLAQRTSLWVQITYTYPAAGAAHRHGSGQGVGGHVEPFTPGGPIALGVNVVKAGSLYQRRIHHVAVGLPQPLQQPGGRLTDA
jgi:hypothetical protein